MSYLAGSVTAAGGTWRQAEHGVVVYWTEETVWRRVVWRADLALFLRHAYMHTSHSAHRTMLLMLNIHEYRPTTVKADSPYHIYESFRHWRITDLLPSSPLSQRTRYCDARRHAVTLCVCRIVSAAKVMRRTVVFLWPAKFCRLSGYAGLPKSDLLGINYWWRICYRPIPFQPSIQQYSLAWRMWHTL